MLLHVALRPGGSLRCAYCHGDLDGEAPACRRCATILHDDCWELARACPSLGCRTWLGIRAVPRVPLASWWLLGWWLAAFAVMEAILVFVVPAFAKMLTETGLSLPGATEVLVAVSRFACSLLGALAAVAFVGSSIAGFRRYRGRIAGWPMEPILIVGVGVFVAWVVFALFTPCCCTFQRL